MQGSATKLRWVMLAGALLLIAVVAGFFGVARYRAGKIWQRILARNGVSLEHDTNGFTWTQSSKGRNVFTLHASKATPQGKNRWQLHDAVLTLYGREPGRDDHVAGKEFEYDADTGIGRALGEVEMDLQAPRPGGGLPMAGAPSDAGMIHVRTSGLVYMGKLGIAATGQPAEFRYAGVLCTSHGAEFDTAQSTVKLLADVHLSGTLRDARPYTLAASHALLDRTSHTATLGAPVWSTGGQTARAAHAVVVIRRDGSLDHLAANGAVELRDGAGMLAAPTLEASFGAADRPLQAQMGSGVRFANGDRVLPANGHSRQLDLRWDGAGQLRTATATGDVHFNEQGKAGDGSALSRQLQGQLLVGTFAPGTAPQHRPMLRHLVATGAARVQTRTQAVGSSPVMTEVGADELTADLGAGAAGKPAPQQVHGQGHTRLEQLAADGSHRISTGDTLVVTFNEASAEASATQVASAVQAGRVRLQSWAAPKAGSGPSAGDLTTAQAAHAVYTAAGNELVLTGDNGGHASVLNAGGELAAETISLHQGSGDLEATGAVSATRPGNATAPASHVLAARVSFLHQADTSVFEGSAGQPAQLWQGGSQVVADRITLDGRARRLVARPATPDGMVNAVFATVPREGGGHGGHAPPRAAPTPGADKLPDAERNVIRVRADRLDYDEPQRQALFAGHVHLQNSLGDVAAQRGAAFLATPSGAPAGKASAPASGGPLSATGLNGSLERMVLLGDVVLMQPGRTGRGDQLTYTAATGTFALTGTPGHPPRVTGEGGAVITGKTLLVRGAESTIVVAGGSGDGHPGSSRVHTELDLKQ